MNIFQFLKRLKIIYDQYGKDLSVNVRVYDKSVGKLILPIQMSDVKLIQMTDKSIVLVIDMT